MQKMNNFQFALHEDCPEFARMKIDNIKCKCTKDIKRMDLDID